MAQAAPKLADASPTADRFGAVAAGGPIADLQHTLEQRLIAADRSMTAEAADIAHGVSRLAGPMLLIAAYAGVAILWF